MPTETRRVIRREGEGLSAVRRPTGQPAPLTNIQLSWPKSRAEGAWLTCPSLHEAEARDSKHGILLCRPCQTPF